ncbi:hypothetical protein [Streptosporangium saharense]|uniref:hypothetical protein n=1 Tax=Streptosporangium saharense TaxID=1706840 RepID=UPI0033165EAD
MRVPTRLLTPTVITAAVTRAPAASAEAPCGPDGGIDLSGRNLTTAALPADLTCAERRGTRPG